MPGATTATAAPPPASPPASPTRGATRAGWPSAPDPANPFYAAGGRYYDPNLAAFTQLDSVTGSAQDPLSLNRYLYAEANPATLIDPSGHFPIRCADKWCSANLPTSPPPERPDEVKVPRQVPPLCTDCEDATNDHKASHSDSSETMPPENRTDQPPPHSPWCARCPPPPKDWQAIDVDWGQVVESAVECSYAAYAITDEVLLASFTGVATGATIAGGTVVTAGLAATAGAATAYNFEHTHQAAMWCIGNRSAPPDAPNVSLPIP